MKTYLYHHGIKGQKWGIRRFQNEDGTRTALGKKREQQNRKGLTEKQKKALKIAAIVGATAVAGALVAYNYPMIKTKLGYKIRGAAERKVKARGAAAIKRFMSDPVNKKAMNYDWKHIAKEGYGNYKRDPDVDVLINKYNRIQGATKKAVNRVTGEGNTKNAIKELLNVGPIKTKLKILGQDAKSVAKTAAKKVKKKATYVNSNRKYYANKALENFGKSFVDGMKKGPSTVGKVLGSGVAIGATYKTLNALSRGAADRTVEKYNAFNKKNRVSTQPFKNLKKEVKKNFKTKRNDDEDDD